MFVLEMFLLMQVHEEKRLKHCAGSVYFKENDERESVRCPLSVVSSQLFSGNHTSY
jgi:hypothetical protein